MRHIWLTPLVLTFLLSLSTAGGFARQEAATPVPEAGASPTAAVGAQVMIQSPKPGQTLQGSVPVVVDTTVEGFQSVELSFSYANDAGGTWFLIYQGLQPVTGTMLALWDTSTITDGDYTLRLLVTFTDGSQKTSLRPDLRVRNYTPVETSTPAPPKPKTAPAPAATLQASPVPTEKPAQPTAAPTLSGPTNPAEIGQRDVLQSIARGVAGVFGLFLLGMLYNAVRRAGRRK